MPRIRYAGRVHQAAPGETVLDALLRQGVPLAFSCRAGSCHRCALRLCDGVVPEAATRGLDPALRARGYFLPCRCAPHDDIAVADPLADDFVVAATVVEKRFPAAGVCVLRLEPERTLAPRPGQHVRVRHPDGSERPYSVASLPEQDYYLDLHVALRADGHLSGWLHREVAVGDRLNLLPPEGGFTSAGTDRAQPLLLLATGTGIAPVLALLRDALHRGHRGDIWLLHGTATREGLYLDVELRALAHHHAHLHYLGCCSREAVPAPWLPGRITALAAQRFARLEGWRVFLAGHPAMVAEGTHWAAACGAEAVLGDAFTGSPAAHTAMPRASRVPPPNPALWTALGEGRVLHAVLVEFYALAFADARLGPYFTGVTQQRLVEKQYSFLRSLILGTRDYFGQRPRNAHHWMVVSDALFDYRLELMAACLRRHGVDGPWLSAWHAYETAFRADVVKREPWPCLLDGQPLQRDGLEDTQIDCGTLCDRCSRAIDAGERVRFHRRLGTTYCTACADLQPAAP